jgi:outer membrane receptor protein involved in Fe transport
MLLAGNGKVHRLKPVCAAVAASLAAGHSGAQLPSESDQVASLIDEVIVTATRRASSLQDIPFNISAMTSETLERLRVSQLHDLSRHVPGLTLIDQGNRGASRMTVRGLNVSSLDASETLFNSSGDTVATYVGEVPVYIDLRHIDLDRVEVLLGPQGTLYGAGTLGGAIRYIPKSPNTAEWEAAISVGGFRREESDGTGSDIWAVLNAPLVQDRLAIRAAISRLDDPGFVDYPILLREPGFSNPQPDPDDPADVDANLFRIEDTDDGELTTAKVALLWQVNDAVSATMSYFYQDSEFGGRAINHSQAIDTGRYESGLRLPEPNQRENRLVSLEVSADLGFAELVSATGLSNYEDQGQRDGTDLLLDLQYGYEDFPNFVDQLIETSQEDRINQEVRLVSTHEGPWNWIVGAYFNRFELDFLLLEFAPGYPDFLGINRPDNLLTVAILEQDLKETAVFGELGYAINERWHASIGVRRFEFKSDDGQAFDLPLLFTSLGLYGPDEVNAHVETFSSEDDGTLFKFNTSYRFNDDVLSYFTISEGYRVGGTNPFPVCPTPGPCIPPEQASFKPDTTTNYELGVRSTWWDGRVTLNAALFHIDWKDVQLSAVSDAGFFITVNGNDAVSDGLELTTQAHVNDRWRASLSYAYSNAELASFAPGAVDGEDGFEGDRLAGTPEHQVGAHITYNRPLLRNWHLDIDYGFTYTSDIYTKVGLRSNGEILDGYTLHNLAATFTSSGNWTTRLFIDNLFDEFAETNVRTDPSFVRNVGVHPLRYYYRNVLRPRQYGFEIRYDFDFN